MLNLTLSLHRGSYAPGETVTGKVILKNDGPAAQVVNSRLGLNSAVAPQPFREIGFIISDPAGAEVVFTSKVNRGFPAAENFKALNPGETIEREYQIDKYYPLAQPGSYTIQAIYQNQSDPQDGRVAWKGEIQSNTVSFRVER